ncbi:putative holin-like toxin [Enterococcus avium]|uniref:putative holin-like toxin n=1 Tax=Enterococcus avium TaxID=33945 RepID=UPI003D8105A1
MPVETALGLMISFGSLIATIIFGILAVVNNSNTSTRENGWLFNTSRRGHYSPTP